MEPEPLLAAQRFRLEVKLTRRSERIFLRSRSDRRARGCIGNDERKLLVGKHNHDLQLHLPSFPTLFQKQVQQRESHYHGGSDDNNRDSNDYGRKKASLQTLVIATNPARVITNFFLISIKLLPLSINVAQ